MGAAEFVVVGKGKTAREAFKNVIEEALYEYGHGGYTGTVAEKDNFVMISLPKNKKPHDFAHDLLKKNDPRISDKWGPAGCIEIGKNEFLFFGLASS